MTKAQRRVLDAIAHLIRSKGCCPTYKEIGQALKRRSGATIHKHVVALVEQGLLMRVGAYRGLELVPEENVTGSKWNSCRAGHRTVLFQGRFCPACEIREAFNRLPQRGTGNQPEINRFPTGAQR